MKRPVCGRVFLRLPPGPGHVVWATLDLEPPLTPAATALGADRPLWAEGRMGPPRLPSAGAQSGPGASRLAAVALFGGSGGGLVSTHCWRSLLSGRGSGSVGTSRRQCGGCWQRPRTGATPAAVWRLHLPDYPGKDPCPCWLHCPRSGRAATSPAQPRLI